MNEVQARELVAALDTSCTKETKARLIEVIGHLKKMSDEEIYPVMMAVLGYAFKRNTHLMSNLLLLGYKMIDESEKGEHRVVVHDFYGEFAKIFREGAVH